MQEIVNWFIYIGPLGPHFYFQSPLFTQIHIYLLLEFCNSTVPLDPTQEIYSAVLFLPSLKFGRPVKLGDFTSSLIAQGIRTTRPQCVWVCFGFGVVIFPFFLDDRNLYADSSLKYCIPSSTTTGENKIYSVSHLHVFSRSHHLFGSPRSQQLVSQKALSY